MDAVLTIDRRCFLGFPTSKSSSSKSWGDKPQKSADGTPRAPKAHSRAPGPGGVAHTRSGAELPAPTSPTGCPAPAGSSGGSPPSAGGCAAAGSPEGGISHLAARSRAPDPRLPALVRHHHWPPAQRRSSRTPPRSSYLWNEQTEGGVPRGSDWCSSNEAVARGRAPGHAGSCAQPRQADFRAEAGLRFCTPTVPDGPQKLLPGSRAQLGPLRALPHSRGTGAPHVTVATVMPGPVPRPWKALQPTHDLLPTAELAHPSPGSQSTHEAACELGSQRETREPSQPLASSSNPAGWGPGGSERQLSRGHEQRHPPVDLALGPACMALSSWSMGWLEREKIQISATLTEASLMLLQRLSTWPPSEGCCITCGQASALEGALAQGRPPAGAHGGRET